MQHSNPNNGKVEEKFMDVNNTRNEYKMEYISCLRLIVIIVYTY